MARRRWNLTTATGLAILAALGGCAGREQPDEAPPHLVQRPTGEVVLSPRPWVLETSEPDRDAPLYLGNGLLGQRIGFWGAGVEGGKHLGAHMAGLYKDEALVTLPSLLPLRLRAGDRALDDPSQVEDYLQELDLREGIVRTSFTWGEASARFECVTALLRHKPETALFTCRIVNEGTSPVRVELDLRQASVPNFPGREVKSSGMRLQYELHGHPALYAAGPPGAAPGGTVDVTLRTTVSSARIEAEESTSIEKPGALIEKHKAAWAEIWRQGIEIEGDPEAQQVVNSALFYLLSSIRPDNHSGVPPMGLSSTAFQGHVFWDMDSWIMPALLPHYPELAEAMLQYRADTLPGARKNAKKSGLPGAEYAWESGATGVETIPDAVFSHGEHVTGDVALAMRQYYEATGDLRWLRDVAWPVLEETARFWVARSTTANGRTTIRQVTTPDENAGRVDDSAWTNHVARLNLEFAAEAARLLGKRPDPAWMRTARALELKRDPESNLILSHSKFKPSSKSKQADALLLIHPGGLEAPRSELADLYDFYQPRVIPNGPAMTEAIHAIVAARLGRGDESLERFRESYRPFLRGPFQLFSEKRRRENIYFLTGAAGVVESVLYGFAGIQLRSDPEDPSRPVASPALPPGWSRLTIRGLAWRGRRWNLELAPNQPPGWSEVSSSS